MLGLEEQPERDVILSNAILSSQAIMNIYIYNKKLNS